MDDFENKLAGICIAFLCAMDPCATERVTEALTAFASDRNTPASEQSFYRDLASSISELRTPPPAVFESLATIH